MIVVMEAIQKDCWSGKDLREMFRTGTRSLKQNVGAINALNVFPVPDGDTGTNMLLTMQAAMVEANQCPDNDASAIAQAMARGALMGARGNSGVILSQIMRGLAKGLDGKESFNGPDIANALVEASHLAYQAVTQPAEGTILTVVREASSAAQSLSSYGPCNLQSVLEATVNEAKESVTRTPSLLPVLKECGVVDAGGQGLCVILEGSLLYLRGEQLVEDEHTPELHPGAVMSRVEMDVPKYGYCTEFLLGGNALDLDAIRATLSEMGDSLLVVGDRTTARIHVHTFDPGAVLSYGTSIGTLRQIKIDNMEDQHREFIAGQVGQGPLYVGTISTIAVASGEGLMQVFASLGATHVINGGQTMNPSVKDLLQATESVPANEVIILPNNPDIIPAAHQVDSLTTKNVAVVPCRTIPQGIAALMAFNQESDLETNVELMTDSISSVRTGEIVAAARSMRYNELQVKKGQVIGLLDEELVVAEYTMEGALRKLLERMDVHTSEIMTVYYGGSADWADAERLLDSVRPLYPDLEIEVVFGGQPYYDYLISVE